MIPRTTSSRWLAGAAVIVAVIIVFSVVLAVLSRDREPDLLPAGTPGRVVQDYILAVQREDAHAAHALLNEERQQQCDPDAVSERAFDLPDDSFSMRLISEEVDEDDALVTIAITSVDAPGGMPLLGGAVSDHETTYSLVREQGEWRLSHTFWPGWRCPPKATPTPLEEPSP
ncbi:MAG: hypothetical protein OXL97_01660 [Chloroflexota bacterium]|nr:hypothetical protein [Chloroflexota bacterium]MDE2886004.1 hypothetical protein [Chloroflexota bacterium]